MEHIKTSKSQNFEFQLEGDETVWSLPAWDRLPSRLALNIVRAKKQQDQLVVLYDFIDENCPGLLDVASSDQIIAIITAWKDSGTAEAGE